jgi:hypothetical protein
MATEHGALVDPDSLGATLDSINAVLFSGQPVSRRDKATAASWIADRQGLAGAYGGMFAPLPLDMQTGVTLFTGERVSTRAGTAHLLGEEACRALRLLGPLSATARQALSRADAAMGQRIHGGQDAVRGRFCCGTCSVAVWRNMQSGGFAPSERFLSAGLATLRARRDGQGRWRSYPYFYTLLCLVESALPAALDELRYAAPGCERLARRKAGAGGAFGARRTALAQHVLARC